MTVKKPSPKKSTLPICPISEPATVVKKCPELAAKMLAWEASIPLHTKNIKKNGKTCQSSLYSTYNAMIRRCSNPNHPSFKDYGARGITIDPRWLGPQGFENFADDVGRRPSLTHSIDRIDNEKGYEPSNMRWSTRSQQNRNKRRPQGVKYPYRGVRQSKSGRWTAYISINDHFTHLGTFDHIADAAQAVNFALWGLGDYAGQENVSPEGIIYA